MLFNEKEIAMIKDRKGEIVCSDDGQEAFLTFLYNNPLGRVLLKLLSRRFISELGRIYMNSALSKPRIKKIIKSANINMSDYENREFSSFNDFFIRKILSGKRIIDQNPNSVISPADSKLTVYDITENSVYTIKGCEYNILNLLGGDKEIANEFVGGKAFVFRLSVDNYHRYCFNDNGKIILNRFIPGIYHTVNPIALEKVDVYGKNSRELTLLETENFGRVAYIEVGAMMVGRINNHKLTNFLRGEEKGYFSFGGSTIIMLYPKNSVSVDPDILTNSANDVETAVLYGERVGTKIKQGD